MFKRREYKPEKRHKTMKLLAQDLIGERLAKIRYFDGANDQGIPFFSIDTQDQMHELMQGVDLVTASDASFSFRWEGFGPWCNYELQFQAGSTADTLVADHPVTDVSKLPQWLMRVNHTIKAVIFTSPIGPNKSLCDCRIDFEEAPSVWICARCVNNDCKDNGDDTIIVFDRNEAQRIGIQVDAR